MAVTDQQKLDFLLKKIGYTKTKTGNVSGTGDPGNGTPKQPFAEALPSPLVVANSSLWNEADSIPATPPGSDTVQVKVYLTTSALRLTEDVTSSGARSWIAYSTYNNTSSARLTNWIDTQFGAGYLIKVYKGDPNASGVPLSAGATNNNWFFDYSAGVLNFNDSSVPVTSSDSVYIVGYRYIGQTGAPTSGISTFSYLDLTVERNLDVGVQGGISTFRNNIDANGIIEGIAGENKIPFLYSNLAALPSASTYHGMFAHVHSEGRGYFAHAGNWLELVNKDTSGNVGLSGDLDVDGHTNLDNVNVTGVTTFSETIKFPDAVSGINSTNAPVAIFGDSSDLIIGHDGANSRIRAHGAGSLILSNNTGIRLQNSSTNHPLLVAIPNGAVSIYHANSKKFETTAQGIEVTGNNVVSGNVSAVDATFSGNVSIGGTLTYEDVTNVDSVGLLTARSGIRVTGGVIEAQAGENKIPSLYSNLGALPSAGTYHGMFAHVHSTGRGYFAHAGNWLELVNKEINGVVGTGTERYNIGPVDLTTLDVSGISTFAGNVDINADIDVDGHTNLDNVSIAGVSTFNDDVKLTGASYSVLWDKSENALEFSDDARTTFGDSKQLKLYRNSAGSSSTIENTQDQLNILNSGTHTNITAGSNIYLKHGTNHAIVARANAEVEIYHNAQEKLATTSTGINVIGNVVSDGLVVDGNSDLNGDLDVDGHTNLDNVSIAGVTTTYDNLKIIDDKKIEIGNASGNGDLQIYHDSSNNYSYIKSPSNGLFIQNSGNNTTYIASNYLNIRNGSGSVTYATANGSQINLRYNSSIKLQTASSGINVTGVTTTTGLAVTGVSTFTGNIDANGNIDLAGNLDVDGHTELDNVNIIGVTTHQGHVLPNVDVTYDLGSSSKKWRNLYADNIVSAPGNGFIGPDLTVRNFKATGISTFSGNATFSSTITAGGATGTNGQYLKTTGTGVAWASFPTLRTRQTFTASAGQTTFSFSYNVNFVDVFVNGIKLTDAEFTATNGSSVVLAVGCFVGDIVELVSYNTVSGGGGGGGGSLNNIVEDTTPQLGGNLDLFNKNITGTGNINITGSVTATNFIGNGSGLTGIVASGSGVVIKNSGSTVGTAGTINFGNNLSVSPASAGIVTITAGVTTSQFNVNKLHVSGITTFIGVTTHTDDVHFGGTNSEVWFWGNVNHNQNYMAWKSWVAGGSGGLFIPSSSIYFGGSKTQFEPHGSPGGAASHFKIKQYSSASQLNPLRIESDYTYFTGSPGNTGRNIARFEYLEGASLYYTGTKRLQTSGIGITVTGTVVATGADINGDIDVDGHTELDNVNISGVVTATTFKGALQGTSGTFSSGVDITGDLDVDGHTDLDNVSVAGVVTATTFVGAFSGNATSATTTERVTLTNQAGDSSCNVLFAQSATGNQLPHTNANLTFNATNGTLFASKFSGAIQATTGAFTGAISGTTATFGGNISGHLLNITGDTGDDGIILLNSAGGTNSDFARIRQVLSDDSFRIESKASGSYQSILKGTSDRVIELHYQGANKLETSAKGIKVGTGVTIETNGQATYTGIVTALKFVGDGSGLTNLPGGGSYGNNDVDNHLNVSGASSGQILSWNGSDYAWVADQTASGGSGISTISGVVNIVNDLDVDGHTNLDNLSVAGVSTFAGITTVTGNTLFAKQVNVSGVSTFQTASAYQFTVGAGNLIVPNSIYGTSRLMFLGGNGGDMAYYSGGTSYSDHIFRTMQGGSTVEKFRIGKDGDIGLSGENYGTSGQVLTSGGSGSAASWTTISSGTDVGITTNLSGTFTASAGSPSTINTFAYHDNDKVVEYTVYIKNGSNFQSQKVLAMRDGTTIHSTQFAVMFSSSLLVQCDATISSGNILLRATPESGVSGSTTYKVKREVM